MKISYSSLLRRIAHFQVSYPVLSLMLLLAFSVAIYGGVSQVKTVASLEQMMPKDVQEIKAFNTLRDNYMGQDMIAVVLQINRDSSDDDGIVDIRDKRVFDYVAYLKKLIAKETDVIEVYGFSDIIGGDPDAMTDAEYESLMRDPRNRKYLANYINEDSTTTVIIATTDVSADDPRMNLLSAKLKGIIEDAGHPPGIEIKYTGTPVIQQKLGELIAHDRSSTRWISTFFVFVITMLIFGTFTSAVVPIIIVTISVNWLYGTMGYANLPISTLAGGVAAMVIGIGIDFAIHILNKFKYERKKGMSIRRSIEEAVVETGTALTATSLTTMVAFLAFLAGAMPEMGRFGILMAIGIGYALIFSLFGLPALLILEERAIQMLRRKLRFGVEGEFSLKKDSETCKSN